ncbi:MAG TPA: hypothetical protein VMT87_03885, partial [Vicinamibacteria bacterium]|nr:hypothetical protein [Vicinamibacteria bacterium]
PSPAATAAATPTAPPGDREVPAPRPSATPEIPRPVVVPAVSETEPVEAVEEPADEPAPPAEREHVPLGGRWQVLHEVESTSHGPFEGLRLDYEVTLFQEGDRVYGQGRKVAENGQALPPEQRTPIDVAGGIEDGEVVLHFTEIGATRTSRGTIRWSLDPEASDLQGRFASDAADTSGSSRARRLP